MYTRTVPAGNPAGTGTVLRTPAISPGDFCSFGGVLFRRKAEITIIPVGDAAAGSRGKTKFFPDLFRAPGGGPVPGRPYFLWSDVRTAVPLFAGLHTTILFYGIGLRLHPSPFRGWLASTGAIWQTAHPHRRQERVRRHSAWTD